MTRARAGWLLALVLAVAMPRAAAADAAAEAEARQLFKQGNQLLRDGDFVGALEHFRAAYQRWPNAKILLNTGATLRKLGRFAEAADTYQAYLRDPATDAKHKLEVGEILTDLETRVATLRLGASEPGARITVDGKLVGQSPAAITVRVNPGNHVLLAEKTGFKPTVVRADFHAGELQTVTLALVPEPAPMLVAPPPPAPEPPRAWPLALVERPLSLTRGMVEGGAAFVFRESPDYSDARPSGLVPRLAVGVTDRTTLAITHVNGICVGGQARSCPHTYADATLDGIFALGRGATAVALHGGLTAVEVVSPLLFGLNLGVLAHAARGPVGVRFDPRVLIALNGRQSSDNRDALFLPLDLELQVNPRTALVVTTRLAGPFDGFATYSELRFDFMALIAISHHFDGALRFSFDNVIHDGSTDNRTIDFLLTLRK